MVEAVIPEKVFYKIGEVAAIASLKPSVLRFWETEFSSLQPQKSGSGQRLYTRKELDVVLEIKRLLYSEKLTIPGARRRIGRRGPKEEREVEAAGGDELYTLLVDIKSELRGMRGMLEDSNGA